MTEPVTLADIKGHLRLDADFSDDDAYLTSMLLAARRRCELAIDTSIVGRAATVILDAFPQRVGGGLWPVIPLEAERGDDLDIVLPGGTVSSVTSISYLDGDDADQLVDPADYVTDLVQTPARVGPVAVWPIAGNQPGAVTIAYVLSPLSADDLACAQQAMRLIVGSWYRNREATQVDARGVPTEIPLSATWLLQPLKQWASE